MAKIKKNRTFNIEEVRRMVESYTGEENSYKPVFFVSGHYGVISRILKKYRDIYTPSPNEYKKICDVFADELGKQPNFRPDRFYHACGILEE